MSGFDERGRQIAAAWAATSAAPTPRGIVPMAAPASTSFSSTILNGSSWSTADIRAIAARVVTAELSPKEARRLTIVLREQPVGVTSTDGAKQGIGWATLGSVNDPVFRIWIDLPAANVRIHNADPVQLAHTIAHEIAHCRGLDHDAMQGDNRYDYSAGWRERYAWAATMPLRWSPADRVPVSGSALRFRGEVDRPPQVTGVTVPQPATARVAASTPRDLRMQQMFDDLRPERWDERHRRSQAREAWYRAATDAELRSATWRLVDAYGSPADVVPSLTTELGIVNRLLADEAANSDGQLHRSDRWQELNASKRRHEYALSLLGVAVAPDASRAPAGTRTERADIRSERDMAVLHARRRELESELTAAKTLIDGLETERAVDRKRIADLEASQERTRVAFDHLRRLDQERTDAYFGVRRNPTPSR